MRRFLLVVLVLFGLTVPAAQAWTWPVGGPVLETFSFDRAHPYAAGERRGVEIGAGDGETVTAPAGGIISFAGSVPGSGLSLTIETPDGYSVTLTHLRSLGVAKGAAVAQGSAVATAATSVHLGIRVTSDQQGYVDPLSFLPARTSPPAPQPSPQPVPNPAAQSTPATAPAPAPQPEAAAQPPVVAPAAAQPAPVPEQPEAPAGPGVQIVAATPATRPGVVVRARPASAERPAPALTRPAVAHAPVPRPRPATTPEPVRAAPTPATAFIRRALPADAVPGSPGPGHPRRIPFPLAGIAALLVLSVLAVLVRMILGPPQEGAHAVAVPEEDPRRARVAVRQRPAAPGPCRGTGCARRHLRALPPAARQRRLEGERHRRARHAGDGLRRPRGRVAA